MSFKFSILIFIECPVIWISHRLPNLLLQTFRRFPAFTIMNSSDESIDARVFEVISAYFFGIISCEVNYWIKSMNIWKACDIPCLIKFQKEGTNSLSPGRGASPSYSIRFIVYIIVFCMFDKQTGKERTSLPFYFYFLWGCILFVVVI